MKCWRLLRLVDYVSGELMVALRNAGLEFGIMNEGAINKQAINWVIVVLQARFKKDCVCIVGLKSIGICTTYLVICQTKFSHQKRDRVKCYVHATVELAM